MADPYGSEADWRAYSDAYNPSDGLIDPGRIPKIPIDVGAMQAAGSRIKSAGIKVHGAGESVDRAWQQLGHSYRAPETPQLLSGSMLVVRKADDVQNHLNTIGDAVWHFAAEMQGLNAQLDGLRAEAATFVAWAHMVGPSAWPEQSYQTGGLGHMPGRDYNDLLAKKVAGVLSHVKQVEQEYAGQIGCTFDTTYDPPPGKPQPFHSRTEAEDAHAAIPNGWRDLDLTGVGLPWGGSKSDATDLFLDGIGESLLSTVLALPGLVGLGVDQSGHFGFSLNTLKSSWVGLGRMATALNPTTWLVPSQAVANVKTLSTAFNGLIGKDANGKWGAKGAGRLVGNIGALLIPGADDVAVGALAEKGAAMAERGGMWAAVAGRAMQAPKWITTGGWVGLDVRGLRAGMDDSSLLSRLVDAPDSGWHLTPKLEAASSKFENDSRGALATHHAAIDDVDEAARAAHAQIGQKAQSDYQSMLEKARADAAGKSPAERTRIFNQLKEQVRQRADQTSVLHDAISEQGDKRMAAIADRYDNRMNDVREKAGLPPAPGTAPAGLPEAEQSVRDRLISAGMDKQAASAGAHELEDLMRSRTPVRDWTSDQRALLATYWSRLPDGLREYLHGDYGWDLATSSPAPADPQNDPAIPGHTGPQQQSSPEFPDYAGMLSG